MSLLRRIKHPVEGSMHVVGATAIDPDEMRAPCHITYVIQAPGIAAFSGEHVFELWTRQWPTPGDDLPVVFDREKPDRVEIQWDKVMSHADSARMHADQLAAQLRGEGVAGDGQAPVPGGTMITPIVIGNASPERVREAMARAEQALGIDLDGDGVVGGAAAPAASTPPAPDGEDVV
ncbi:MAG TPA: hypothetical protein VGM91_13375 [Conexibacter sp.]|jgi:hypothetical protein